MDRPRIAFVLYQYPLGFSTMVINSVVMFARHGHGVDVYIDGPTLRASPIEFSDPNIRVVSYEGGNSFLWRAWAWATEGLAGRARLFNVIARSWPYSLALFTIFPRLFLFARWLQPELAAGGHSYVIPVEATALLALNSAQDGRRIVYYDMELLDWTEDDPNYRCKLALKHLQSRCWRAVSRVVIQSPRRAEAFARINGVDAARIAVLPVAAMGDALRGRGRYFRDRFGVDDATVLVVYSGNFAGWAQCVEIIESVRTWPSHYALVMHTWQASTLQGKYFREMQRAATGLPVFFSAEYLSYDELANSLSSCDIGILLYEAINENFTEILFSSNKLTEYLKAGLPVICSDFPTLTEFVERWDIGVPVASAAGVPEAVERVGRRLEAMTENARRCYEAELRFERHFEKFYDILVAPDAS